MKKCFFYQLNIFILVIIINLPVVASGSYNQDDTLECKHSTQIPNKNRKENHSREIKGKLRANIQDYDSNQLQIYKNCKAKIFLLIQKVRLIDNMIADYREKNTAMDKVISDNSKTIAEILQMQQDIDGNKELTNICNQQMHKAESLTARALISQKETCNILADAEIRAREAKFELLNLLTSYLTSSKYFPNEGKGVSAKTKNKLG